MYPHSKLSSPNDVDGCQIPVYRMWQEMEECEFIRWLKTVSNMQGTLSKAIQNETHER